MADPREMPLPDSQPSWRVLEPMDRISEVLFGLIMVLTFTCTLGVVTADGLAVRTMVVAALGCNLAWGIIDGGVYLMARLNERGRRLRTFRAVRDTPDAAAGRRALADALPPLLAPVLSTEQLETMRRQVLAMPDAPARPGLARRDWLGALAICLLSFLSTFPVVIPFMAIGDPRLALRVSNLVAMAMLFLCGYAYGRHSGINPWGAGLAMVAVGAALVAVAIALGG